MVSLCNSFAPWTSIALLVILCIYIREEVKHELAIKKKKSKRTASVGRKRLWGRKHLEGCSKVSKYQEKVVKTNWTEAVLKIARKDS